MRTLRVPLGGIIQDKFIVAVATAYYICVGIGAVAVVAAAAVARFEAQSQLMIWLLCRCCPAAFLGGLGVEVRCLSLARSHYGCGAQVVLI